MTRLLLTVILALAAVSVVAITAGADRGAGRELPSDRADPRARSPTGGCAPVEAAARMTMTMLAGRRV